MEIVVNDTNILIDLYNAGLLDYCARLDLEFRTLDLIIEEISIKEQRESIDRMIALGILKVCSLSERQVTSVFERIAYYNGTCNLSAQDISVLVYAIDNNCRLLTGDKTLREKASMENVKVSGILFLTDMLSHEKIIDHASMIIALEKLMASNNRLPSSLIKGRIESLQSLIETEM